MPFLSLNSSGSCRWTILLLLVGILSKKNVDAFVSASRNDSLLRPPLTLSSLVTLEDWDASIPLVPLLAALTIGVAAQTLINSMLQGDQGLGAFLRDGSGFNKSGFRPTSSKEKSDDPLPWLPLPWLDFVDVAGQVKDAELMSKLEEMRRTMEGARSEGRMEEAEELRRELEGLMEANGIEFTPDEKI